MSREDIFGQGEKACLVRLLEAPNPHGPRKSSSTDRNTSFLLDPSDISGLSAIWTPRVTPVHPCFRPGFFCSCRIPLVFPEMSSITGHR